MIKTVIVSNNGKLEEVLQFEVPTEDFDLRQAIREACLEYCKTEKGWRKDSASKIFDVKTFLNDVPDVICKKYRFWRSNQPETCMVMECFEQILTRQDVEKCMQYNIGEATACFARMWGVMEVLENIPRQDLKETADMMISWAKEFTEMGEKDPILFFKRKIEERT